MIPTTSERVPRNTSDATNQRIRQQTEESVRRLAYAGPQAIDQRLRELDAEWDVERTLEANAATAVLVGSLLGATVDRRLFVLPGIVAGFLLQHAVQGWCPPLPILRRLGFRTEREIDEERNALKAMRGDYRTPGMMEGFGHANPQHSLEAARA